MTVSHCILFLLKDHFFVTIFFILSLYYFYTMESTEKKRNGVQKGSISCDILKDLVFDLALFS